MKIVLTSEELLSKIIEYKQQKAYFNHVFLNILDLVFVFCSSFQNDPSLGAVSWQAYVSLSVYLINDSTTNL